jgi:mono/diheme cytochrome c family protein
MNIDMQSAPISRAAFIVKSLIQHVARIFCISLALALADCESITVAPPPVTPELTAAQTGQRADLATLQAGRDLFVSRCIECHTLPTLSRYDPVAWPWLVKDMAARASLKPAEREAIVAYILAVRAQTK